MLSLVAYAISQQHTSRREICSMEEPIGFPFLAKVFGDTLIQNGHEHISLMPFLLLNLTFRWGLAGTEMNDRHASDKILFLGTRVVPLQNPLAEERIRFR